MDFTYTTSNAPGQLVDVLGPALRGVERSHTVQESNATDDMVARSMYYYEQHRSLKPPPYSFVFKDDDQSDSLSLWVKISPFPWLLAAITPKHGSKHTDLGKRCC